MVKKNAKESIPPLQNPDGPWALTALAKVETLATCFKDKFVFPESAIIEDFGQEDHATFENGFLLARSRWARKLLQGLEEGSANGPDGVPSQVLKQCGRELAYAVAKLVRLILMTGRWQ